MDTTTPPPANPTTPPEADADLAAMERYHAHLAVKQESRDALLCLAHRMLHDHDPVARAAIERNQAVVAQDVNSCVRFLCELLDAGMLSALAADRLRAALARADSDGSDHDQRNEHGGADHAHRQPPLAD